MPYKNSSQIVIGDRSTYNKRQFVSTHMNTYVKPKQFETGNSGIIADQTIRSKHLQELWNLIRILKEKFIFNTKKPIIDKKKL